MSKKLNWPLFWLDTVDREVFTIMKKFRRYCEWRKLNEWKGFERWAITVAIAGIFRGWKLSRNAESRIFAIKTFSIMTPAYSMNIFPVKTFANCPETAKFAKVFTCKRFPLYGSVRTYAYACAYAVLSGGYLTRNWTDFHPVLFRILRREAIQYPSPNHKNFDFVHNRRITECFVPFRSVF